MKIGIDRESITLAQLEEAREMAKSEAWIDKDTLKICASAILENARDCNTVFIEDIVSTGSLAITTNHYRLTVYAKDVLVKFSDAKSPDAFALLAFDVLSVAACEDKSAFVQIFDRSFCGVVY